MHNSFQSLLKHSIFIANPMLIKSTLQLNVKRTSQFAQTQCIMLITVTYTSSVHQKSIAIKQSPTQISRSFVQSIQVLNFHCNHCLTIRLIFDQLAQAKLFPLWNLMIFGNRSAKPYIIIRVENGSVGDTRLLGSGFLSPYPWWYQQVIGPGREGRSVSQHHIWWQFKDSVPPQNFDEFGTSNCFPLHTQQWSPLISSVHQSWMLVHLKIHIWM